MLWLSTNAETAKSKRKKAKNYVAHLEQKGEWPAIFNIDQIHFPCADCTNIKLSALYTVAVSFIRSSESSIRLFVCLLALSFRNHPFNRSTLITYTRMIEKAYEARHACAQEEHKNQQHIKCARTHTTINYLVISIHIGQGLPAHIVRANDENGTYM